MDEDFKDFYSKIIALKEIIDRISTNKISLEIAGDDISMQIGYENGFRATFDLLDSQIFNLDEYNEEVYDQLYIESDSDGGISNFFIPLYWGIDFSEDGSLIDEEDAAEYDEILLIIHEDSIDYIFYRN